MYGLGPGSFGAGQFPRHGAIRYPNVILKEVRARHWRGTPRSRARPERSHGVRAPNKTPKIMTIRCTCSSPLAPATCNHHRQEMGQRRRSPYLSLGRYACLLRDGLSSRSCPLVLASGFRTPSLPPGTRFRSRRWGLHQLRFQLVHKHAPSNTAQPLLHQESSKQHCRGGEMSSNVI